MINKLTEPTQGEQSDRTKKQCPKCLQVQDNNEVCIKCGLILKRYKASGSFTYSNPLREDRDDEVERMDPDRFMHKSAMIYVLTAAFISVFDIGNLQISKQFCDIVKALVPSLYATAIISKDPNNTCLILALSWAWPVVTVAVMIKWLIKKLVNASVMFVPQRKKFALLFLSIIFMVLGAALYFDQVITPVYGLTGKILFMLIRNWAFTSALWGLAIYYVCVLMLTYVIALSLEIMGKLDDPPGELIFLGKKEGSAGLTTLPNTLSGQNRASWNREGISASEVQNKKSPIISEEDMDTNKKYYGSVTPIYKGLNLDLITSNHSFIFFKKEYKWTEVLACYKTSFIINLSEKLVIITTDGSYFTVQGSIGELPYYEERISAVTNTGGAAFNELFSRFYDAAIIKQIDNPPSVCNWNAFFSTISFLALFAFDELTSGPSKFTMYISIIFITLLSYELFCILKMKLYVKKLCKLNASRTLAQNQETKAVSP
jgi:hypothetical protein